MAKFHYLARAVIFSGERVLLAHEIGAESTFLPGGHIGYGEPAKTALIREIKEETGVEVSVGRFLGAVCMVGEGKVIGVSSALAFHDVLMSIADYDNSAFLQNIINW